MSAQFRVRDALAGVKENGLGSFLVSCVDVSSGQTNPYVSLGAGAPPLKGHALSRIVGAGPDLYLYWRVAPQGSAGSRAGNDDLAAATGTRG